MPHHLWDTGGEIAMDDPSIADSNQYSAEHHARRLAARKTAQETPPPRRRFGRELLLIGVIIGLAIFVESQADVPNPEHPEAQAIADRLYPVFASVWRGDSSLKIAADAADLSVYEFEADGRTVSILTHSGPTAEGLCYGVRMGGGLAYAVVSFTSTDGCVPEDLSSFAAVSWWEDVFPPERITPWWFFPALVVLAGAALRIGTSIVLKLIHRKP